MMNVTVKYYRDDKYEGYEAHSDSRCIGTWEEVSAWVNWLFLIYPPCDNRGIRGVVYR